MTPKRNSLFNKIPLWKPKMSSFNLSFENKFSTDLFRLTPVMCKEVLPDDRVKLRPECFTRMSPAIAPFFHRLNIRFYHFFVPTRIIWEDFEKWINPKTGSSDLVAPRLTTAIQFNSATEVVDGSSYPSSALYFGPKTLADYLGVNFGMNPEDQSTIAKFASAYAKLFPNAGMSISELPFRAYQQIYNDWFIDLNNADVADFSKGSGVDTLASTSDAQHALYESLLKLRYRAWEHDYFTSALPEPQRGPDVNAFDGSEISSEGSISADQTWLNDVVNIQRLGNRDVEITKFRGRNNGDVQGDTNLDYSSFVVANYNLFGFVSAEQAQAALSNGVVYFRLDPTTTSYTPTSDNGVSGFRYLPGYLRFNGTDVPVYASDQAIGASNGGGHTFALGSGDINLDDLAQHLNVDIQSTGLVSAVTVEELRVRMQMQSFLERNEVGGSRYTEMLYAHWGVKDPDGRLQRSEFLGGHTQPLVVSDVQSTVADDENDKPLGMFAGQGTSASGGKVIKYRVPEHGFILTLMCIVPRSAYSQGLEKMWTRFDRLDYYWPSFSHLGEQEVKNSEIMFTGLENSDGVFGYQSRYAEYKTSLDQCHGDMKSSLAHWHMGRLFDTPSSADDLPKLSQNFTTPTDSDADALSRVWPVLSGSPGGFEVLNADHFVFDVYMHLTAGRRMPYFVTPRNGM